MDETKPRLAAVDRRRFLKVAGVAAGLATAGGVTSVVIHRVATGDRLKIDDVLVRNPAFHEAYADADEHCVLYCQRPGNELLAFDLNGPGHSLWQQCVSHSEFSAGKRRTIAEIAAASAPRLDVPTVADFAGLMYANGLVFLDDEAHKVYFSYVEPY